MSKREIVAYAITRAAPGVKGGPYTGNGSTAHQVPSLALARRYPLDELYEAQADVAWLVRNEYTARVIRIVRKARPSEASAVEVLRSLVAKADARDVGPGVDWETIDAARAVLASGPDPMPIVRARPSEASAVEVLRELVAIDDALNEGRDPPCSRAALAARARRVLAAAGPDPMPIVRAAMAYEAAGGESVAQEWRTFEAAVKAYRKAGGK